MSQKENWSGFIKFKSFRADSKKNFMVGGRSIKNTQHSELVSFVFSDQIALRKIVLLKLNTTRLKGFSP